MEIVSQDGKLGGFINIIDALIILIIIVIITSVIVYVYFPPPVKEHKENVLVQMYFENIPYTIAKQMFIVGNEFTPSYDKGSKAVIIKVLFLDGTIPSTVNILATVNTTAEKDVDGQYLFDGFDLIPAIQLPIQINSSPFVGVIYRIGYIYNHTSNNVTLIIPTTTAPLKDKTALFDTFGNYVGNIIMSMPSFRHGYDLIKVNLSTEKYDSAFYFNEIPLTKFNTLVLKTNETILISGQIIEVET